MAKVKVALNGHGSIGKRIADTVFITQDLGAIRINPIFITKLMLETL
jgi:glyceraldehyde-3-phosphate dehydrogenase/erythrose-4-phosphate dehydrogenase